MCAKYFDLTRCIQADVSSDLQALFRAVSRFSSVHLSGARVIFETRKAGASLFFRSLLLILLATCTVSVSHAESYFSIDGSKLTLLNDTEEILSPAGMRFRLGTQMSSFVDVEGHFGFSFSENTEEFDELAALYMGGFLKAYVPIGDQSALFGLAGWTTASLSQQIGAGQFNEERAGFSWGFGFETRLTAHADLTADYVSYIRSDGLFEEVSAWNVGIKLYFN